MTDVTPDDRLMRAIREIIRAEFPQLAYLGVYEYAVQSASGTDTVDARPVDETLGLPDLVGCPLYPGILGEQVHPATGSLYRIAFIAGDPTRPIVVGGDPANPPDTAKLLGGGAAAARVGDTVNAGYLTVSSSTGGVVTYYPGTSAGLAAANAAVSGSSGALTLVSLTSGQITSGSSKVEVG